ncbi:hypothetical protein [Hyphomonas sp.]|uniref:hypothetical protein n=1 Tax=Hyphomonas sp. TaxID=87 RepID=UPI00391A8879
MSLAYPIARSLEEATRPGVKTARTQREAVAVSEGARVDGLETSWLHLTEDEAAALVAAQGMDGAAGHLQRYEDTSGHVVVAVTWWKLADPNAPRMPAPPPPDVPLVPDAPASDHTDDLYFRRGRTKPRRKRRIDPNQLDLFDVGSGS